MSDGPRATVRVQSACNNLCVFCAQDGSPEMALDAAAVDTQLAISRQQSDEVTFVGGEPTLHDDIAGLIKMARGAGFRRIGLQTNARRLANAGFTRALVDAGLTDVHVSIHGADSAVHDYHTAIPGSFVESMAGIAAARGARLAVVAATVLTRSNFRVISEIPRLLSTRGVSAWMVSIPDAAGRAAKAFDRVVPRLALALPFALHALESARVLGLPAWIRGAPLCALGPFAARALSAMPRAYAPVCDTCPSRPRCPGLDPIYLARFGGDELTARAAPVAVADNAELARMFVGTGERFAMAAGAIDAVPASPARARVALPMLGKVQPALDEVQAGTAKRSGEALKEIFPGLFDKDPNGTGG